MKTCKTAVALIAVLSTQGCLALARAGEAIAPKCLQEQIVVTWPMTTIRGGVTTSTLRTTTLTQNNIDRTQFDALRETLTGTGTSAMYNVTWSVPSFDVNGGYVAFTHTVPFSAGETRPVSAAFSGGGWGAQPTSTQIPTAIALRADNFVATSSTGSIIALAAAPLRLKVDVTTASAAGETIRVTGEVGFSYHKVTALCN